MIKLVHIIDNQSNTNMFSGKHGYVELAPIANTNHLQTRTDDDEAFVLELEDYLDQNESHRIPHPDHNTRTDGISRDISKMSMKGYTDDPYLLQFNNIKFITQIFTILLHNTFSGTLSFLVHGILRFFVI